MSDTEDLSLGTGEGVSLYIETNISHQVRKE